MPWSVSSASRYSAESSGKLLRNSSCDRLKCSPYPLLLLPSTVASSSSHAETSSKLVITLAFCDASYAANKKTRKSHSGYVIFVNKAPIKWVSRRQNTLETSAFSAEFITLKQCIEDIEHLRFKLRMFGVPISDTHPATYIYCDNDSVVKNSSRVDSTLNEKHSEVAYHFTRWNVTAQVCTIGWIETGYNIADAFMKRLASLVRDFLFGEWTY